MNSVGAGTRAGLWLAGYAALIGIGVALDFDDQSAAVIVAGIAVIAAYGFALGYSVPRWAVLVLPLIAAGVLGAISSIGYDGEDTLTMLIVLAEIYLGILPALGCALGIVARRLGGTEPATPAA